MELDHISFSKIKASECFLYYRDVYRDKKYEIDNEAFRVGRTIHAAIKEYTDYCTAHHLPGDAEEIDRITTKACRESEITDISMVDVIKMATTFAENELDFEHILMAEKEFVVPVGRSKTGREILFKGILDRVDVKDTDQGASVRILDYKSQRNVLTKEDVEVNEQLRLYRYAVCFHLLKNFIWVTTGIHHLRYGFTRWGDMKYIGDLGQEFFAIEKFLTERWEWLNAACVEDKFPAIRCKLCWDYSGCPVMAAKECPLWTKKSIAEFKAGNDVASMVRYLRALDRERDVTLVNLKEKMRESPPVEIDGVTVGYSQKPNRSYRWKTIRPWVAEHEAEAEVDFKVSATTMKEIKEQVCLVDEAISDQELERVDAMAVAGLTKKFEY